MRMTRWQEYFLNIALINAQMSKDPNTGVGAVIVGVGNEILSTGFNGLPRYIEDSDERLNNRDVKHDLIIHAEMNAIISAARNGARIVGGRLYVMCYDKIEQKAWGTAPCVRCASHLIQAGISTVVFGVTGYKPVKDWDKAHEMSLPLFTEAGISIIAVDMKQ